MKNVFIISDFGSKVGLGHFKRSEILTKEIKRYFKKEINVKNFYFGSNNFFKKKPIKIENFKKFIKKKIIKFRPNCLIFNISRDFENIILNDILRLKKNFPLVKFNSLDGNTKNINAYDILWIPNIFLEKKYQKKKKIFYGWDKIFIDRFNKKEIKRDRSTLLISIGGTDKFRLTKKLPIILQDKKFSNLKFLWVRGPFSKKPTFKKKNSIKIIEKKLTLHKVYMRSSFAIVLFGVSFFETVHYGIPQVIHFPKQKKERDELLNKLKKKKFLVSNTLFQLKKNLITLIENRRKFQKIAKKNSKLLNFRNRKKILNNFIK